MNEFLMKSVDIAAIPLSVHTAQVRAAVGENVVHVDQLKLGSARDRERFVDALKNLVALNDLQLEGVRSRLLELAMEPVSWRQLGEHVGKNEEVPPLERLPA